MSASGSERRGGFVRVPPSCGSNVLDLNGRHRDCKPPRGGTPTSFCRLVLLFVCWSIGAVLQAAAPSLTHLFPAGGKQGTSFPVTLGGKVAGERAGVWVSGYGVTISAPDAKGNATATLAPDAPLGLRMVRAFNAEGASAVRWFSVGLLPEAAEVEPNDALGSGQKVDKQPVCVNGVLEKSGDIDGFTIQVEAGRTIVAQVEAYALGSPIDPVLNLFDEQGTRIATAHDGRNLDPFLAHKVEKTGRYSIQISGFTHPPAADVRFTGGASIVYRMSLTTEPMVTQLLPAVVPFGVKSPVELRGHNLDKINPAFEVDGSKLAVGETLPLLQLPKWSVGPIQVLASPTIPVVEKEPNNTTAEATFVGLPCVAGGTISAAGDVDRFAFQAKKGERLMVRVRSKALGMPLDASLRIEAVDGKVLASNDDQGDIPDPMASFTATADGTFQAVVTDLFNKGGERHGYVLEIGVENPDFDVSLTSADAIVLAAGKTTEVTAKVKRLGGLTGPLIASINGLPPGVLAETALVDEKKGEVKLTLVASANAPASASPIALAVFAKDGKPVTHHTAVFALRGENKRGTSLLDESDQMWLTVTPGKPEAAKKSPLPVLGAATK